VGLVFPCTVTSGLSYKYSESELLQAWEQKQNKAATATTSQDLSVDASDGIVVTSPLSASVWKIKCKPGDRVDTADDVLAILGTSLPSLCLPPV
jgi:biotin carboxyl carrier protein